jgi:NAD(P)-dependent dehydrogenase (short-subunit alcohol dehydrogenase family)
MTQLRFDDRVAVVTGAGHGLGRGYALLLAARGAKVVVNDLGATIDGAPPEESELMAADRVVREIESAGGQAVTSRHDIADEAGAQACVQTAVDTFGRVDIVINNAGINPAAPFADTSLELFQRVLAVHLLGTWSVTQAAWPHFRAQQYGRVINTSSGAMYQGHGVRATYVAAKAAIYGLSRDLAVEGEEIGVRVNTLCPGALTRMLVTSSAEQIERMKAWTPDAVANVVAVLAHESCPVSGEMIEARGGEIRRLYMAITPGVHLDPDALTPELVAENLDQILAQTGEDTVGPLIDLRVRA